MAARLVVLADDLIWATRLVGYARAAGADPIHVRTLEGLAAELAGTDAAIVDLTSQAYDGLEGIAAAVAGGLRVLAVGQHDDLDLRKAALSAGAERVFAYRKLFEDGPATLATFLGRDVPASSS